MSLSTAENSSDTEFTFIDGQRVRLRRFRESDLERLVEYRSNPEVERYQNWSHFDLEQGKALIEEMQGIHPGLPGRWFQFAIALLSTGELIGDCAFHFNDNNMSAEMGFTLGPEFQNQGLATDAVTTMVNYLFSKIKVQYILAVTDALNTPSIKLLERLGMQRDSDVRDVVFKGRFGQEYLYSLSLSDWNSNLRH
jgi:RimJ/RimL family protein N-acetyltransferase